jgi:primosomal protein N' (replication factor Y) (superfamily II helicase)
MTQMMSDPTTRISANYVQVALDLPLDRPFTYAVPDELRDRMVPGLRVEVPFGRGNKPRVGYVVELAEATDLAEVKNVTRAVDDAPLIEPDLLELARWMATYYVTPLGQVLTAILPAAVKKDAGFKTVQLVVRGDKTEADVDRVLSKQQRVLDRIDALDNPVTPRELARMAGCTTAVIKSLEKKGLVKTVTMRTEQFARDMYVEVDRETPPELNNEQRLALQRIKAAIAEKCFGCVLVNGVTGSGKTELYLRAIQQVVDDGGQAIVLVPEIALTPQTIRRFRRRFSEVAVLHSHLTDVERHREWRDIRNGRAQVIVGARSAVFAPARDLKLIVIDEEHETSFKQDTAPRYHARDVALVRAQLLDIPVVLGSATPSLESKNNCQTLEHYHEARLTGRVRGRPMPPVEIVDLKHTSGERRGFHALSLPLENAIREALDEQEQVILFLNRRGFSTYVFCPKCGYVHRCHDCDVAMTFHRAENVCRCHYCDKAVIPPETCPACSAAAMNYFGLGTERLEDEVREKFELARVARMDSDTMRARGAHNKVLTAVRDRQVDILIGTQMIAKGLDFPNVTLVGVINADMSLNLPDFRAAERTFQLISQVAGRAGRGPKGGRILVQTFNPDHMAVQYAARHDYESFAAEELDQRRKFGYPPFVRLARILVRGPDEEKVCERITAIAGTLREASADVEPGPIHLLGPAACPIARINRQYRYQLLVKAPQARSIMRLFEGTRDEVTAQDGDLTVAVDVDPSSTL